MNEEDKKNVVVVTWDFTQVSEYALQHAVQIASALQYELHLLHIVKPDTYEATRKKAEDALAQVCHKTYTDTSIPCTPVIRAGSLFTEISDYGCENYVRLVVMGTHGIVGSQKLFGSKALKVLIGSKAPFIVVQAPPKPGQYLANVVFPIDFKSENKEKVQWAVYLGRSFGSKIHLYKSAFGDSDLKKKSNTNINFAVRFLKQNNIAYEIVNAPKGSFNNSTIRYAEHVQADLIVVSTTKAITTIDYMFGANEQHIIANSAQIPVMCMNPMAGFARVGQFMFGA